MVSGLSSRKNKFLRPKADRRTPKTFLSRKMVKELLGDKNFVRMLNAYVFLDDRAIGKEKAANCKRPYYTELEAILKQMHININSLYPPNTSRMRIQSRDWRKGYQAKLDERYG